MPINSPKKKKGLTDNTANPLYSFGAEAGI